MLFLRTGLVLARSIDIKIGDYTGSKLGCDDSAIDALMPITCPFSGFL
jgi:hypothetical protein